MPSVTQRKCACGRHSASSSLHAENEQLSGTLLQRQCACGQYTIGGGQCRACRNNSRSPSLQRSSAIPTAAKVSGPKGGLPADLRHGLEQLSGFDLSAVRVHYNDPQPAQLKALATAQGTDIRLGPGQEKHLPHESWHVVQQMQGRVRPTLQAKHVPANGVPVNGIAVNDEAHLEREADHMGARARELGRYRRPSPPNQAAPNRADPNGATLHRATLYRAGIAGTDETLFHSATRPGFSAPVAGPVVQRKVSFKEGVVSATTNMAAQLIAGKFSAGFTPPLLNGTAVLSEAAAKGALNAPVLKSDSEGETTEVQVATVPDNEASYTMQLPDNGPWSTETTKAEVKKLFAAIRVEQPEACDGDGESTFSVKGQPSDADFAANVKTHEELHAADHEKGFNEVLKPWDEKLEEAADKNTKFSGPNQAGAEKELYKSMGGTPDEIAAKVWKKWIELNNETHKGKTLATGGLAMPSNPQADDTCSTSSLDVT